MKQLTFFPMTTHAHKAFAPQKGRRKSKRPLSSKHPIHLTMHSQGTNLKKIERAFGKTWQHFGQKFGLKTYRLVICGTHIHAIVRLQSATAYIKFVRAFTGTLAHLFKVKWLNRPATRISNWGRDFQGLVRYLKLNFLEAEGFLEYQPQRTRRLPHYVNL